MVVVILTCLGCGVLGPSRTDRLRTEERLAAAGFRRYPADTPQRLERLGSMKPLAMTMVERQGTTYYVVADPDRCRCLWVGGEQAARRLEGIEIRGEIETSDRAIKKADLQAEAADVPGDPFDPFDPAFFGTGVPDTVP